MKRKNYLLLLFLLMFVVTLKVKASTCSNERILELSSLANNVNVSYQEYDIKETVDNPYPGEGNEEETYETSFPGYYLTIYNLDDGLNVAVKRDDTNKVVTVNSEDKDADGVVYIDTGAAGKVKTFTIAIRSNDSNCKNEILQTKVMTTPMYNFFSSYDVCKDNPDFDICKEFTTVDYSNLTDAEFMDKLDEYKVQKAEEEKKQKSIIYQVGKFLSDYKWYIIISILVIVVAIIVIYVIRRKKSRLV